MTNNISLADQNKALKLNEVIREELILELRGKVEELTTDLSVWKDICISEKLDFNDPDDVCRELGERRIQSEKLSQENVKLNGCLKAWKKSLQDSQLECDMRATEAEGGFNYGDIYTEEWMSEMDRRFKASDTDATIEDYKDWIGYDDPHED